MQKLLLFRPRHVTLLKRNLFYMFSESIGPDTSSSTKLLASQIEMLRKSLIRAESHKQEIFTLSKVSSKEMEESLNILQLKELEGMIEHSTEKPQEYLLCSEGNMKIVYGAIVNTHKQGKIDNLKKHLFLNIRPELAPYRDLSLLVFKDHSYGFTRRLTYFSSGQNTTFNAIRLLRTFPNLIMHMDITGNSELESKMLEINLSLDKSQEGNEVQVSSRHHL